MRNLDNDQVSFRIPVELKAWINDQGASVFLRELVYKAFMEKEGKPFVPTKK